MPLGLTETQHICQLHPQLIHLNEFRALNVLGHFERVFMIKSKLKREMNGHKGLKIA